MDVFHGHGILASLSGSAAVAEVCCIDAWKDT